MNNLEILKTGIENFGLEATEEKLQNLKKYREILVEWNKVMNLTGIEEEREVYIKHFLDSISAVTNNYINDDISLIDVGTGAGFPGMPLKICLDNLKLTLLDSLNKRINSIPSKFNSLATSCKKFILLFKESNRVNFKLSKQIFSGIPGKQIGRASCRERV